MSVGTLRDRVEVVLTEGAVELEREIQPLDVAVAADADVVDLVIVALAEADRSGDHEVAVVVEVAAIRPRD